MTGRLPIDKRSENNFWVDQHTRLASEQIAWVLTADQLLRAFQLLAQQAQSDVDQTTENTPYTPEIASTAMMLGGFAIENLLKAICIPQTQELFDRNGNFNLNTHNLLKLAENADISLATEEQSLLERLEQFATWAGRYPTPKFSDDMRPRTLPNGGFAPRTSITIPNDFAAVTTFAQKLKAMLPNPSEASRS